MGISSVITRGLGQTGSNAARLRRGLSSYAGLPARITGKQFMTVAGLPWPSTELSYFQGASPAVVNGDIAVVDLVTSPNGYAITPFPDGSYRIATGSDTSRQSFVVDVWDVSAGALMGAATVWTNNRKPVQTAAPPFGQLTLNVAFPAIDLTAYVVDSEGDALVYTVSPLSASPLPTGVSLSGSSISGAQSVLGSYSVTIRATDITGDYTDLSPIIFSVPGGNYPNVLGYLKDAAINAIVGAGYTPQVVNQVSTASIGTVIAQSPAAGPATDSTGVIMITVAVADPGSGGGIDPAAVANIISQLQKLLPSGWYAS